MSQPELLDDPLNEREFELVNIIGSKMGSNQRDLSRHMELSLGMTNMLIRRMISKGYIRIRQLNKKKVEYILTPKGFSEKMRKSVKYTLKTINSIGLIKGKLKEVILKYYAQGERNFFILGSSDLATLVEIVFKENCLEGYTIMQIREIPAGPTDGIFLICKEDVENDQQNKNWVDLIEELSKDDILISSV